MGGKEAARRRRGASRGRTKTLSGMSSSSYSSSTSSSSSSSSSRYRRRGNESDAGSLLDEAVEGFRSWRGEGSRLMCAVCITSATCVGMEEDIVSFWIV